ncbi:MAG: FAD-dependent thymidylate synthase [Desulfurococcaceae archaeon]
MSDISTKKKYMPNVNLVAYLQSAEKLIASSAKLTISPRDFNKIFDSMGDEDIEKWIKELLRRGHGSPLEHSIYVFEVICSRACSHQLVRHRHASYTQYSQRYSDKYLRDLLSKAYELFGEKFTPEYSKHINILVKLREIYDFNSLLDILSEGFIIPPFIVSTRRVEFLRSLVESLIQYYMALATGASFEDARYLLPQAIKTRLIVSMNARELVEVFLPLRMCSRAQWEIRMIAWDLWKQLLSIHSALFKYTGPRCVIYDNRVRDHICSIDDYLAGTCKPVIKRCPELVNGENMVKCLYHASRNPYGDYGLNSSFK